MRIALVQCPPWGALPPIGIAALKAWLEPQGHTVRCHDLSIDYARERQAALLDDEKGTIYSRPDPFASEAFGEWSFTFDGEVRFESALREHPLPVERWADQVLEGDPDVVGFSIQSSNLGTSLQVAQRISQIRPEARLVFGGPNAAKAQEGGRALETGIPHVVVEGEGEETFTELLHAWEHGGDPYQVRGIGRLVDGRPVWNEVRPLMRDIDALPFPDFTDFDWAAYPNPFEIPIMTSRGCVLNCAFCYETQYWKRFRTQSSQRIVDEILHQVAIHPFREQALEQDRLFMFSFGDSLVNGHLGGLRRMAELLIESPASITWCGQATINQKMDGAFFRALRESGCTSLSFGMESGSQDVLESMGKKFQSDEAITFFDHVHEAGIQLIVNVMVGFPTETRRDFVETLRFLWRIRKIIDVANNVDTTSVNGGTRLQESPEQFGIVPVDIAGWEAGTNYEWTSEAAGDARNRVRRLLALHAWLTVLRIPHQPLPTRFRFVTWMTRTARRLTLPRRRLRMRQRRRTRRIPGEPLVLVAVDQVIVEVIDVPAWIEGAGVDAWVGQTFAAIRPLVVAHLGSDMELSDPVDLDGVHEVRVSIADPHRADVAGLRIFSSDPDPSTGRQTFEFYPTADRRVLAAVRS